MAPDDDDDPPDDGPSILERWTRDLGQLARTGQLRPALFRESEINQAAAALKARRSVLLVGPTGVGKSCLVAALATAMPPELEWQSGRSDALKAGAFHELRCRRVEAAG